MVTRSITTMSTQRAAMGMRVVHGVVMIGTRFG